MATEAPAAPAAPTPAAAPAQTGFSDANADAFFSSKATAAVTPAPATTVAKTPVVEAKTSVKTEPAVKAEKKTASVFEPAKKVEAAPAKVETAAPVDRFPEPEKLSDSGKTGWKALKDELARAENDLANHRAQLDTYKKATPAEAAETAKLRADYQTAQDRLALIDIQSTEWYSKEFSQPKTKALADAQEVLNWNDVQGVDVAQLLAKPKKEFNAAISEITKGMNSVDASTVINSLRSAHELSSKEKSALSNSGELRQKIEAQTAQQQKAAFEEAYSTAGFDVGMFEPNIPEDASEEDKTELRGISDAMRNVKNEAEKLAFGRVNAKDAAKIALKAAFADVHLTKVIPRMHKEWARVSERNKELEAENAALKTAKSPGSFSGDRSGPGGEKVLSGASDAEADSFFSKRR